MRIIRPAALAAVLAVSASLALAGCGADVPAPTAAPVTTVPARPSEAPDPSVAAQEATYGDWRRAPVHPTPEFAAAAENACREEASVGTLPLAVLDTRGEGRATLVFDDGTVAAVCRAEVDADGTASANARGVTREGDATPPPVQRLGAYDLELVDDGASSYTVLVGQVGGGVHDVAVSFDADRAWYTAAMDNGWYAIWWPGAAEALSVAASDMRSVALDHFTP